MEDSSDSSGSSGSSASSSDTETEQLYTVEEILSRRFVNGQVPYLTSKVSSAMLMLSLTQKQPQYLLKWEGYDASQNTWEPIEHLVCPGMVRAFEAQLANGDDFVQSSFLLGLTPVRILEAYKPGGQLMFLLQFAERRAPEMVLAIEANIACPSVVIAFYEERLRFEADED